MKLFRYKYNVKMNRKFKFCSRKCVKYVFSLIGYKKPTTWIKMVCFRCKKSFRVSKTNYSPKVNRGTRKTFCSANCKNSLQKEGGPLSPRWKGGRGAYPSMGGYITLNIGPNVRVAEHRYIMEKHLRRKLKHGEVVHHINGNPSDNRIENLVVCKSAGFHTAKYHPQNIRKNKYAIH